MPIEQSEQKVKKVKKITRHNHLKKKLIQDTEKMIIPQKQNKESMAIKINDCMVDFDITTLKDFDCTKKLCISYNQQK